MDLTERKMQILEAIIDDYIATCEPVGSRTIAKRNDLNLSPATIRNEMADLEDMGFLEKPHTSSGRIPSHQGYRFYVDSIMRKYYLSIKEINSLTSALRFKSCEPDKLVADVTDIISKLTSYTAILVTPKAKYDMIMDVKLVNIGDMNIVIIIVLPDGAIKSRIVRNERNISDDAIIALSTIFSRNFRRCTKGRLTREFNAMLRSLCSDYPEMVDKTVEFIGECLSLEEVDTVCLGGILNIMNFPEYNSIEKVREFLSFVESKDNVLRMVQDSGGKIKVTIGNENQQSEINDCSVIVARYAVNEKIGGRIGLVGPTRMNYAKIISNLECISANLGKILNQHYNREKGE